jgi:prophage regulatory protein
VSNINQNSSTNASSEATGFMRLSAILAPDGPLPIGRSTWWAGVKAGRYPKPVKLGPRITAWRVEDILGLIKEGR